MIKKPDIPPTMNSETSEETLLRLQQERDGFLREKEEQDIKDEELEQKLKILGEKLGIKPETQESSETENKKTAEQILDESKERAKIESEIKDKLEAQKAKIEIRKSFLSPVKKLLFEKLSKAGTFIGTNWDKLKETQGFQKGAAGLSAYSQFMNGGKEIFRFQNGTDKDGNPTYYRYTWRKLALSSAIAGTAVAFLPVTGVAAASMFGTKIARGFIGGVGGAKAIEKINRVGQEKISKLEMKKGDTNLTEEQLVSLEKKIRRTKLATKAFAMSIGIGTGYALAILAGEITGRIGTNDLGTPKPVDTDSTKFKADSTTHADSLQKIKIQKDLESSLKVKADSLAEAEKKLTELKDLEAKGDTTLATKLKTEEAVIKTNLGKVLPKTESLPKGSEINNTDTPGYTYAFKNQLENNKELAKASGYDKLTTDKARGLFLEKLGTEQGYLDENGNEIRIKYVEGVKINAVLEYDESTHKLYTEEYRNGELKETHHDGDLLEKDIEEYEYNDKPFHRVNHKIETAGGEGDTDSHSSEGDDKYKIKGGQKDLPDLNETKIEKTFTIKGDQKDLPDLNKTEIEKPFIIKDTIWEKPTKLGVDYYLHGNDNLKGLDKGTLDALLRQGIVIDRQTINPLGIIIHNYEMKDAGEILKLRDDAEFIKARYGLKADALNTDPLENETMEEYRDRLTKSIDKIEKDQQNIKTNLEQQKNAIDYAKGRRDGFYDAAYAESEHRYKVMRNRQITNGFLNLIFRNNRYYGGYNSGYYNSNGGYYR